MWRNLSIIILLSGCDKVLGLESRDAAVFDDAPTGVCPALLPYDAARYTGLRTTVGYLWTDARTSCARIGMDLAVLDEGDGVELAAQYTGTTTPFWLGVTYGDGWAAIDGCTPTLTWAQGEPAVEEPGYCVIVTEAGMVAERCSSATWQGQAINALCETPRPSDACRILQANSRYAVGSQVPVNYPGALATCGQLGMHVVEINSSEELVYVRRDIAPTLSTFWLGGRYTGTTWTSPTTCPELFHWQLNQPNTASTFLKCARHDAGGKTDYCSNGAAPAICEENTSP